MLAESQVEEGVEEGLPTHGMVGSPGLCAWSREMPLECLTAEDLAPCVGMIRGLVGHSHPETSFTDMHGRESVSPREQSPLHFLPPTRSHLQCPPYPTFGH